MYCPKCKSTRQDNGKYCPICGTLMQKNPPEVKKTPGGSDGHRKGRKKRKRNMNLNIILIPLILLLFLLFLLVGFYVYRHLYQGSSNKLVYVSDDSYYLTDNQTTAGTDAIRLLEADNGEFTSSVEFESTGKYVYFLTGLKADGESGTLVQVEVSKANGENSDGILTIADHVKNQKFLPVKGSSVLYLDHGNRLYLYRSSDTVTVKDNVFDFYLVSDTIFMLIPDQNGSYDLYQSSLDSPEENSRIASGITEVLCSDQESLYYEKADGTDEGLYTVYKISPDTDEKKILEKVREAAGGEDAKGKFHLYLISDSSVTQPLYDYVTDDYSQYDEDLHEPEIADYTIPTYRYYKITDAGTTESDYQGLYTCTTHPLAWYRVSGTAYSMQDALGMNWGDDSSAILTATQQFISNYGDTADENGIIDVTENVKNALKQVNASNKERSADEWIELCLYREKVSEEVSDRYYTDLAAYQEASDRKLLRQELENTYLPLRKLSVYDGKNLETLQDEILSYRFGEGCIFFNGKEVHTLDLNIEDGEQIIYNKNDLQDFVFTEQSKMLVFDGDEITLSENASDNLAGIEEDSPISYLYADGSNIFAVTADGILFAGAISEENISQVKRYNDNTYKSFAFYNEGILSCTTDHALYFLHEGESEELLSSCYDFSYQEAEAVYQLTETEQITE